MITTANTLTQSIVYTIPAGSPTGYTTATLALYVTNRGNTTRYVATDFNDCTTTTSGHITVSTDIPLSTEGTYRLEFKSESSADIDVGVVTTTPIASTIIRKVIDANANVVQV